MPKYDRYEWTRQKTFSLIKEYESYPILWNTQLEEYRDRNKRTRAVNAISAKLGINVDEINRKIHNLRNQVSQELQKIRRKKSQGLMDEEDTSQWPYFAPMSFIIPTMTSKVSNFKRIDYIPVDPDASCSSFETSPPLVPPHVEKATKSNSSLETLQPMSPPLAVKTTKRLRPPKSNHPLKEAQQVSMVKSGQKRNINVVASLEAVMEHAIKILNNPVNDSDTFGEYVAMELKNLKSEHNKARLKSEIRKAISRIADEDMNQHYLGSASTTITSSSCPPPAKRTCSADGALNPSLASTSSQGSQ